MAPISPANNLQAGTYSARMDRLATACLLTPNYAVGPLAARTGVKPAPSAATSGLLVTQRATPDMNVTVGPGTCYIQATSATGGTYECHNDANFDVAVTAAHASLARKDLIVMRVYDAVDDTGALNQLTIEVVTGTPASSPALPAAPSQTYTLAQILVPAASTSVVTARITDVRTRTVALGGVLPCRTSADVPATPYPGMVIYREDLAAGQVYNGSGWATVPAAVTTAWQVPTLGSNWATGPASLSVQAMKFRINTLGCLEIVGAIHCTTGSPAATLFTLPTGYRPTSVQRPNALLNHAGTTITAAFLEVSTSGAVQVTPAPTVTGTDVYCYANNIPLS